MFIVTHSPISQPGDAFDFSPCPDSLHFCVFYSCLHDRQTPPSNRILQPLVHLILHWKTYIRMRVSIPVISVSVGLVALFVSDLCCDHVLGLASTSLSNKSAGSSVFRNRMIRHQEDSLSPPSPPAKDSLDNVHPNRRHALGSSILAGLLCFSMNAPSCNAASTKVGQI